MNPNAPSLTVSSRRPLASIWTTAICLDTTEDGVLARIESGDLIAFDIRTKGARRACVRVLVRSISDAQRKIRPVHSGNYAADLTATVEDLIGHSQPVLRGIEIARILTCSSCHVLNLVRERVLTPVPGQRRGRKESPRITRASFIAFLAGRSM